MLTLNTSSTTNGREATKLTRYGFRTNTYLSSLKFIRRPSKALNTIQTVSNKNNINHIDVQAGFIIQRNLAGLRANLNLSWLGG